jgi:hypothetical protein
MWQLAGRRGEVALSLARARAEKYAICPNPTLLLCRGSPMSSPTSYAEVFGTYLLGIIMGDLGRLDGSSVVVDDNSDLFDDSFIRATFSHMVVLIIASSRKLRRFFHPIADLIMAFFVL